MLIARLFKMPVHLHESLPADRDTAFVNSDIHDVPPFHIGREVDWYEICFYCFSSSLFDSLFVICFTEREET